MNKTYVHHIQLIKGDPNDGYWLTANFIWFSKRKEPFTSEEEIRQEVNAARYVANLPCTGFYKETTYDYYYEIMSVLATDTHLSFRYNTRNNVGNVMRYTTRLSGSATISDYVQQL